MPAEFLSLELTVRDRIEGNHGFVEKSAMIVNVSLSAEAVKRLSDKAAREGQTLEGLLQDLAEHEAEASTNGSSAASEPERDEKRPWRGVFVLDYPRREIFTAEQEVNVNALPSLPPEIVIDPRRLADDSE
jgi:hypothetical protein